MIIDKFDVLQLTMYNVFITIQLQLYSYLLYFNYFFFGFLISSIYKYILSREKLK